MSLFIRLFNGSDMESLFILLLLCSQTLGLLRVDPLVSTKLGLIRGLRDENGYAKFLGIPYGKIDENNIFGTALPHPEFTDIFDAYDESKVCVQTMFSSALGTPDCLTMNIFVPDTAHTRNRLPVMVWIHGGGFIGGSANREITDPHYLLKHEVIIVTINYRVGIYGFMCLDIPEVPGNTGLKDQVLALRWINENIEAFGGDANQITVFGESAGGMSVNLHLFSSYEKLFQKAIIQSGAATSPWVMVESDNTIPIKLAEGLGFNTTDIYEALSFLSHTDPHIVALAASDMLITSLANNNQPLTKPCVEKTFDGVENFLTEHPMNIKSTKASTTPVIIGYNSKELAGDYAAIGPDFADTYDFSQVFALSFERNNEFTEAIEHARHFYIGDEGISEEIIEKIVDFESDFIFGHPTQRMIQNLLGSGAQVLYSYVFSYSGSEGYMPMGMNKTWTGAAHGEELMYLFDLNAHEKTWTDQLVGERFQVMWTNFAKNGDPTPEITELLPVKWKPVTKTSLSYLEMDADLILKSRPYHDRMAFWDLFYKQYGYLQKW